MTMTEPDLELGEDREDQAETDEVRLPGRRATVMLDGGEVLELRITNRDHIAWDMTAPKKKWGQLSEVPYLAATFMSWTAAKREGKTELTFEQWKAAVLDIDSPGEDVEDMVRPTQRTARPETS